MKTTKRFQRRGRRHLRLGVLLLAALALSGSAAWADRDRGRGGPSRERTRPSVEAPRGRYRPDARRDTAPRGRYRYEQRDEQRQNGQRHYVPRGRFHDDRGRTWVLPYRGHFHRHGPLVIPYRAYAMPYRFWSRPWWTGAPQLYIGSCPYYFNAGVGFYIGGAALQFQLGNFPPDGCAYYDPYCEVEFSSLTDYQQHCEERGHQPAVSIVNLGD